MRGSRAPRKIDVIRYQSNIIHEQGKLIEYLMDLISKNIK